MQLNIDTLNIHLHEEPALNEALTGSAAEPLAETPECEANCGVTEVELSSAVAKFLAGVAAAAMLAERKRGVKE